MSFFRASQQHLVHLLLDNIDRFLHSFSFSAFVLLFILLLALFLVFFALLVQFGLNGYKFIFFELMH